MQEQLVEEQGVAGLEAGAHHRRVGRPPSRRRRGRPPSRRRRRRCRSPGRGRSDGGRGRGRARRRRSRTSATQTLSARMPSPRNAPSWCQSVFAVEADAAQRALVGRQHRALAEVLADDVPQPDLLVGVEEVVEQLGRVASRGCRRRRRPSGGRAAAPPPAGAAAAGTRRRGRSPRRAAALAANAPLDAGHEALDVVGRAGRARAGCRGSMMPSRTACAARSAASISGR